ncbi:hypothetical protein CN639_28595 [Bacillus toyonensis]|uniref:Uncharacterized protein n=1 Tax=Bacillus toyonensis TaxID=155322 RepID=A0AB36SVW3_9BACI|nr:hypothetical protein CON55_24810 [Bacillus toyonensis]PEJ61098.1 hypothetical protein CN906_26770 [Bacillus toyonensis]PEM80948.1 hypothetical protein CN639_28595 [Bacillus toyonensis]PEN46151.1 hypothetical protein CN540_29090 [Bacillus toyonensis]PEN65300.1 hypothetical protein CN545_23570 [Bacillus toyonensis]
MLCVDIINILYNENLFFLTHFLQITYVQNSFYNNKEGAFVPIIRVFFSNKYIKKTQCFFTSVFLIFIPIKTK